MSNSAGHSSTAVDLAPREKDARSGLRVRHRGSTRRQLKTTQVRRPRRPRGPPSAVGALWQGPGGPESASEVGVPSLPSPPPPFPAVWAAPRGAGKARPDRPLTERTYAPGKRAPRAHPDRVIPGGMRGWVPRAGSLPAGRLALPENPLLCPPEPF